MRALFGIAWRSAWNRRLTLALVALSIALAAGLLVTLERLRADLRASFSQAVSGTDLVVGARTAPVQLMLLAVFRIGQASNGVSVASLDALARHRAVAWVLPLALGDAHRGRPVLGTDAAYFDHFRYGDRQPLAFSQGRRFAGTREGLYEAVVGAEVAHAFGYRLGQTITLAHGAGVETGALAAEHDAHPFTVVGVLAPTGTPVDRTVHVSLEALEALHVDYAAGAPLPGQRTSAEAARALDLTPKVVTAALVGLKSRSAVFAVQRWANEYEGEALSAALPGVALDELWSVLGAGERALAGLSLLVAVVSVASLVAVVLAGLNERRRELAVLRAVGAGPRHVLALLAIESTLVTLAGAVLGALASALALKAAAPLVQRHLGITLDAAGSGAVAGLSNAWLLWAAVVAAGMLAGLLPAWRAYRMSLADGLSPPG